MKTVNIEIRAHEDYGTWGLVIKDKPWMEPFAGMTLAHDILEHFADDKGDTESELQALGASLYVRNGDEWYARRLGVLRAAENIAGEFPMQCRYREMNGVTGKLRVPPRTLKCDEWLEDEFDVIAQRGRLLSRAEFDDGDSAYLRGLTEWLDDKHRVMGWLRSGYRKAQRRYARYSTAHMCAVFIEVARCADALLKWHADMYGEVTPDPRGAVVVPATIRYSLNRVAAVYHVEGYDE